MFGMFPFGRGNMISFTSFTSITSTRDGINGFNITNGYSGVYDPDQINNYNPNLNSLNEFSLFDQIQNAVSNALNNVDIQQIAEQYLTSISNDSKYNTINNSFYNASIELGADINAWIIMISVSPNGDLIYYTDIEEGAFVYDGEQAIIYDDWFSLGYSTCI